MSLPSTYNLLTNHPNRYFVETGSYRGDAIQQAIDAGFTNIRSVDIDQTNIDFCTLRFDLIRNPRKDIRLWHGDSATMLPSLIEDINEPITFWLDSHWQLFEHEPKGENPFPLLLELQQIAQHPVKTHTIIIDDILYMTHPKITGWSLRKLELALLHINSAYRISLVPNPVVDNLLICTL